jgi:multiple sugar transport system permease protein
MTKNKYLNLILACVITFSAINLSAGWIENKDDKTVIHLKIWQLPSPSMTDTFSRAEVAGVNLFVKRFPEIFAAKYKEKYKNNPARYGKYNWDKVEIELEQFTGINVEGVELDLLGIAGGTAPDVLYINFRKSYNYIFNNFLYPLDNKDDMYLSEMSEAELSERIHPKLWPVIKRKGPEGAEHVWALPYGGAIGKVLLYRKDLFELNKIPPPDNNWTWDKMYDAAKKLTDPKKGTYGAVFGSGKHESWHWVTFLWSAGGEVMSYNENANQWSCIFDSEAGAKALEFYTRLNTEKWTDKNGKVRRGYATKDPGSSVKWEQGLIGMQFAYIEENVLARINSDVTGMAPVPIGPGGNRGGELNSRMMGIYSQIKDSAVRDAAWEYMKFYDSDEAMSLKMKIMVEGGLGQFMSPKNLRKFGYPEVEKLAPKGWSDTFKIAIETGRPEPYGKNSNIAYDMMTFPIQEAEDMSLNNKLPGNYDKRIEAMRGLLVKACGRANEEMIGIVPHAERVKRRISAAAVIICIIIAFSFVVRRILNAFTPKTPVVDGKSAEKWGFFKYRWAYIILIPAVLSIFIWQYLPLFRGSIMAFYDYKLIGKSTFVGIDNFGDLLYNSYWWNTVWNSLRYSTLVISLTFLPPIILAILLQEIPKGKVLFRTIYYLPAVITGIVTVLLWKQFFDKSEYGMLNVIVMRIPAIGFIAIGILLAVLAFMFARRLYLNEMFFGSSLFLIAAIILFATCLGAASPTLFPSGEIFSASIMKIPYRLFSFYPESVRWIQDTDTAMLSCVIPMVWAGMGPGCLIYLAALKGIPDDYYEAAEIDGAGFIDQILFVVFPTLKALIVINFIGVFIASWYSASGILVMTGGGYNTEVADLQIWFRAFTNLQFGPATAMAWVLGFMMIGFTMHQLKMLSRVEFKAAGKA